MNQRSKSCSELKDYDWCNRDATSVIEAARCTCTDKSSCPRLVLYRASTKDGYKLPETPPEAPPEAPVVWFTKCVYKRINEIVREIDNSHKKLKQQKTGHAVESLYIGASGMRVDARNSASPTGINFRESWNLTGPVKRWRTKHHVKCDGMVVLCVVDESTMDTTAVACMFLLETMLHIPGALAGEDPLIARRHGVRIDSNPGFSVRKDESKRPPLGCVYLAWKLAKRRIKKIVLSKKKRSAARRASSQCSVQSSATNEDESKNEDTTGTCEAGKRRSKIVLRNPRGQRASSQCSVQSSATNEDESKNEDTTATCEAGKRRSKIVLRNPRGQRASSQCFVQSSATNEDESKNEDTTGTCEAGVCGERVATSLTIPGHKPAPVLPMKKNRICLNVPAAASAPTAPAATVTADDVTADDVTADDVTADSPPTQNLAKLTLTPRS